MPNKRKFNENEEFRFGGEWLKRRSYGLVCGVKEMSRAVGVFSEYLVRGLISLVVEFGIDMFIGIGDR